jgi:peptidoglycan/xylan/chitin deacetylase (PgdA/CDA1 family)
MSLRASRSLPLVVLYHGVTDKTGFPGIENYRGKHVRVSEFARHISYLEKHFTIVPLGTVETLALERRPAEKPLCAITFDDGYRNNYEHAFPLLKARGLPATIFVAADFLDHGTPLWPDRLEYIIGNTAVGSLSIPWQPDAVTYQLSTRTLRISADKDIRNRLKTLTDEERDGILGGIAKDAGIDFTRTYGGPENYLPLSWQQVHEMSAAGIEIGAHTVTHPILGMLPEEKQRREIALSAERVCSKIGRCRHFAYPNGQRGDWNEATHRALSAAGFGAAWTTIPRRVSPKRPEHPFELPRITLDESGLPGRFEALVSDIIPRLKKISLHR